MRPVLLKVDSSIRYQTIEGWGARLAVPGIPFNEWLKDPTPENYDRLQIKDPVPDEMKAKMMDGYVFDLGLTRFRLEIGPQVKMRNNREDYRFKWQDFGIQKWLFPLKQRIESRGEAMILYISYDGRSSLTPAWLLQPGEYAEMAVDTLAYLKRRYNLEPDYWAVLNEPGNQRPGNPQLVAQLILVTGKRIREAGFRTRMAGPEVVTPKQITPYMKALSSTPDALKYLGQLTYHLYWDPMNIAQRNEIRDWGQKLGITTAQTEWLEGKGLNVVEALYLDLTEANASVWERYGLKTYLEIPEDFSSYRLHPDSWYLRQVMYYVRPGDVRVGISSPDPLIKPLAFRKGDGRHTVVVINSGSSPVPVRIENLPPGTYGINLTDSTSKGKKMPQREMAVGQALLFEMPAKAIATFHPV